MLLVRVALCSLVRCTTGWLQKGSTNNMGEKTRGKRVQMRL